MPIASRLSWDNGRYQGFRAFQNPNQLHKGDRVVIVWFDGDPDVYLVDCEAGIGEIRRYYREGYDRENITMTLLLQDAPSFILVAEYMTEDGEKDVAFGPICSEPIAQALQNIKQTDEGFLGSSIMPLTRPE